jgi:hypothetical protein
LEEEPENYTKKNIKRRIIRRIPSEYNFQNYIVGRNNSNNKNGIQTIKTVNY